MTAQADPAAPTARPAPDMPDPGPAIMKVILFSALGTLATVLGFVFLPVAGAAIALLVGWRGLETHYRFHGPAGLRIVSIVFFTGFAAVATVMGFVFMPIAGAALAVLFLWWGFGTYSETERAGDVDPDIPTPLRPSPNRAFEAYRADTLRRLEEEQDRFEAFLGRLRAARGEAEFDAFMEDRARRAAADPATDPETDPGPPGGPRDAA